MHFSEEITSSKLCCFPSETGSTPKGNNLESQFFPLRVKSFSEWDFSVQNSKQEVTKVVSLYKNRRKSLKRIYPQKSYVLMENRVVKDRRN